MKETRSPSTDILPGLKEPVPSEDLEMATGLVEKQLKAGSKHLMEKAPTQQSRQTRRLSARPAYQERLDKLLLFVTQDANPAIHTLGRHMCGYVCFASRDEVEIEPKLPNSVRECCRDNASVPNGEPTSSAHRSSLAANQRQAYCCVQCFICYCSSFMDLMPGEAKRICCVSCGFRGPF